ncbi:MAG: hypothetical protein ACE14T_11940 [Syntrophales bacterium]
MHLIRVDISDWLRRCPPASEMQNQKGFVTIDDLHVFYSEDNTPWGFLKHASISRSDRYPTWEEILAVKEELFGDIDCMMVMPKKEDYVNIHNNCFHVWQTPENWGIR